MELKHTQNYSIEWNAGLLIKRKYLKWISYLGDYETLNNLIQTP